MIALEIPTIAATAIRRVNRTVSIWAVAAGVTSIATTRMIPTACRLTTIVRATSARNRYSSRSTGMPDAAAPRGSKVAYSSSFHRSATTAITPRPRATRATRSWGPIASTLPNRKLNRSATYPWIALNMNTPSANVPANSTPIAVSWRMPARLVT